MRRARQVLCLSLTTLLGSGLAALPLALAWAAPAFTLFESGQVRPLAPDAPWLFAVNTPDNRLEVFQITGPGLAAPHLRARGPRARGGGQLQPDWLVEHPLTDATPAGPGRRG